MGVMSRMDALQLAKDQDLDLVEVSPNAKPPVVKVVDWGKYNYQKTKQLQKQKKTAKNPDMKQIRMGLKIGDHDLDVKLSKATKFFEAGHKVKFTLVYRGREMAHRDIGFQLAQRIIERFTETGVVEQKPQMAGRQLTFVLRSQ